MIVRFIFREEPYYNKRGTLLFYNVYIKLDNIPMHINTYAYIYKYTQVYIYIKQWHINYKKGLQLNNKCRNNN